MSEPEMSVESIRRLVDSDSDGPIEAHCRPAIRWLLEVVTLTPSEEHALNVSSALGRAMHDLIEEGPNADSDWLEIASKIHDLQARIMMGVGARAGHCRTLGGGK